MDCVLAYFIKCAFDASYFKIFWEILQRQLSSETTFDFCCELGLYVFHCEKY